MSVHTTYQLNPLTWYGIRELNFKPNHFVTATTEVTSESLNWIAHSLVGRYTIVNKLFAGDLDTLIRSYPSIHVNVPAFEDPAEATLYELTWS